MPRPKKNHPKQEKMDVSAVVAGTLAPADSQSKSEITPWSIKNILPFLKWAGIIFLGLCALDIIVRLVTAVFPIFMIMLVAVCMGKMFPDN